MTVPTRMAAVFLLACTSPAAAEFRFSTPDVRSAAGSAQLVSVGDVTGDGRPEVVLLTESQPGGTSAIRVLPQRSVGKQLPAWTRSLSFSPSAMKVGDLVGGGGSEIVLAGADDIHVLTVSPVGGFSERVLQAHADVTMLELSDLDRDGNLDIVAVGGGIATVLYGDGNGGVSRSVDLPVGLPQGLEVADMNGDGYEDILVAANGTWLYRHTEAGFQAPIQITGDATDLVAADFTGDGLKDLVTLDVGAWLHVQEQDGSFGDALELALNAFATELRASDVDGDGLADLLVAHYAWDNLGVLLQRNGSLAAEVAFPENLPPDDLPPSATYFNRIADGDVDGDGCMDVAMTLGTRYGLFRGRGCVPGVDLAVAISEASGGAQVRVANAGQAHAVVRPLVMIDISMRQGVLNVGAVPEACVLQSSRTRSARIECLLEDLPPGAQRLLAIPLSASLPATRERAMVSVRAVSDTPEQVRTNNQAVQAIGIAASPLGIGRKR
jgi:hypothetical protein